MVDSLPQPGQIVAGKYRLVRVLGEGGMGLVYEAEHVRLAQRVALKMLLPELLRVEDLVKRFDREARAASQLRSRHTARVMDVDHTPDGIPYMVMEFLSGRDLDAELEARHHLPIDEAVDYVLQACGAMDEAHALGIIHRDLKPSNVFLADERGTRIAKILDFGISKLTNDGDAKLTSAEAVMGTAMYMAPEQVRASHNVDSRADIWSLGVVLYELLVGHAPFVGTPTQVAAAIVSEDPPAIANLLAVPEGLSAALTKCLARKPSDRFATVRDLMRALLPFAPPGSEGAITARQLLGADAMPPRSSIPEPSTTTVRPDAQTVAVWTNPHSKGSGRSTIVGAVSVLIAVTALGFIAWNVLTTPKTQSSVGTATQMPMVAVPSATLDAAIPAPGTALVVEAPHVPAVAPSVRLTPSAQKPTNGGPKASAAPKPTPSTPPVAPPPAKPTADPSHI